MIRSVLSVAAMVLVLFSAASAVAQSPGTIVFSKTPVDPSNPTGLTDTFTAGDTIYGLAFLPDTFKGLSGNPSLRRGPVQIVIDVEGVAMIYTDGTAGEAALERTHFAFDILPDPSRMSAYVSQEVVYSKYPNPAACEGPIKIADAFRKFPPGSYNATVTVKFNYRDVATGSFAIKGDAYSGYETMMHAMITGADEGAAKKARMPNAGMKHRQTESAMIDAIAGSNDWKTGRIRANQEVLRLVIVDSDWMVRRHAVSGAILHRYIRAAAAVKDHEGQCWVYPQITFQEDYAGGKFQPLKYDGAGDRFEILCENVNR